MLRLMFNSLIVSAQHLLNDNISCHFYNLDKLVAVLGIDDSELSIRYEFLCVQENESFQNESFQNQPEEKYVQQKAQWDHP